MKPPSRTSRPLLFRVLLLAGAVVLSAGGGVSAGSSAWAKDGPANPLPAVLETFSVGPAIEFRQVVLHAILLPKPDPKAPPKSGRLPAPASTTPAGAFGLGDAPSDSRTKLAAKNLGITGTLVHPGDLIRTDGGDYVVRTHEFLAAGQADELRVVLASREPPKEKTRPEPAFLTPVPGPAFLWFLLTDPKEKEVIEVVHDIAKEIGLDTPRKSPGEFATAPKIAARVAEYEAKLRTLPVGGAGARRDICGVAIVIDGGFAGIEVFGDRESFASTWPGRLTGIAVEAAVQEVEMSILDKDLPAPTDPDRFIAEVKQAMLGLYDTPDTERRNAAGFGTVVTFAKKDDLGRAAIAEDGRAAHFVVVRDPAARKQVTDEDGDAPAPGPISRKARPTEFEKRWLDRRAGRKPEIPGGAPK